MDKNISILIPARNEEAVIGREVKKALSVFPDAEVLVIDNGSTDKTWQAALDAGASCISCTIPGKGAAMLCGVRAARGRVIVFHDADGEYEIEDSLELALLAAPGIMCVGCRNPFALTWSSKRANAFIRRLLQIRFGSATPKDILSGSRAFWRNDLLRMPVRSRGFGIETELTAISLQEGFRIVERPVRYSPRTKEDGKKIRSYHLLTCAWAALRHYGKLAKGLQPVYQERFSVITPHVQTRQV